MAEVRWHRRASEVVQLLPGAIADRILQGTRLLGQFPELGKRVYDPQWPSLRRIVVRDWNVIYAYDSFADVVTVVGVIAPGTGHSVQ
jgi:mRNA-degrading endonuclease RelE of RelBE toxin-antitoxin system